MQPGARACTWPDEGHCAKGCQGQYASEAGSLLCGRLVVRVFPEDHEVLHDGRNGEVFLRGQLGPVGEVQKHRRGSRLEARDLLRATGLAGDVHGLAHPHGHVQMLEVLVHGNEPSWPHRRNDVEEHVVALAEDRVLQVQCSVGDDDQRTHRDGVDEEAIAERGVDRHEPLAHVEQTLSNSHHEERVRVLGVVRRKLPQQAGEPGVVGPCAGEAHA
mmetsp:Transcript_46721/g.138004  ORF Transcript_46721/g.138004 Transcript_46721/m.138004 type:complete len:216 (+) Transcript_46721:354-1001(+)